MCVLCDRSRNGYAIAHAVCVCATPVRNRNHAEPASIGETISIKMSPPFGCVDADYTNAKHIMAWEVLQVPIFGSELNRVVLYVPGSSHHVLGCETVGEAGERAARAGLDRAQRRSQSCGHLAL